MISGITNNVDRAQEYYDDLLVQGYPEEQALKWTSKHYPDFQIHAFQPSNLGLNSTEIAIPSPNVTHASVQPNMADNIPETPTFSNPFIQTSPIIPLQTAISKRRFPKKTVSSIATIIVSIVVISVLPPGSIGLIDDYRDRDGDGLTDAEEVSLGTNPMRTDTDGDGLSDPEDYCPNGEDDWESTIDSDRDGDGCKDDGEDDDDDDDGYLDENDMCPKGELDWENQPYVDLDSDGCTNSEDIDDDGDNVDDSNDGCPLGLLAGWESNMLSDHDSDGCRDNDEDSDDDGDLMSDGLDECPRGETGWISSSQTDHDTDGCKDSTEDFDDDDDGILDSNDFCKRGHLGWTSSSSNDNDGDGCKDSGEDLDDDNDGFADTIDVFPFDSSEWFDFDEDGVGDNSDDDDDNDGVPDVNDANDYADVGIIVDFNLFQVISEMDHLEDEAEVYICMYVEGEIIGCSPEATGWHWVMTTSTIYSLNTQFFVDLPEENDTHLVQICAWDDDVSSADDRIDISPLSSNSCYGFHFESQPPTSDPITVTATGVGDETGYDGEMEFTYQFVDVRTQRINEFEWDYDGQQFSLTLNLDYDIYSYYKNLDHTVSGDTAEERYARFPTPQDQYVVDLADSLEFMAIINGYDTTLEKAEFVYAFVGAIQYVRDINGTGVNNYPKYSIEMLWESSGDCEDAAILYISIIEALGYDAMLARGLVLQTSDDAEWGGHVWAVIHIPDHSNFESEGWNYGLGSKSDMVYYFVETTAYYEGSYIGRNPWYDIKDVSYYDVE